MRLFGKKPRTLNTFEKVKLRLSGMRITEEYELEAQGETAELRRYEFRYRPGAATRILTERAPLALADALELLRASAVISWDGFVGNHPRHVLDGTMFTFEALVNGGEKIYAHGSENFPKHFREFCAELRRILRESGEEVKEAEEQEDE